MVLSPENTLINHKLGWFYWTVCDALSHSGTNGNCRNSKKIKGLEKDKKRIGSVTMITLRIFVAQHISYSQLFCEVAKAVGWFPRNFLLCFPVFKSSVNEILLSNPVRAIFPKEENGAALAWQKKKKDAELFFCFFLAWEGSLHWGTMSFYHFNPRRGVAAKPSARPFEPRDNLIRRGIAFSFEKLRPTVLSQPPCNVRTSSRWVPGC